MTKLSLKKKKEIAEKSYQLLSDRFFNTPMTLNYSNAWELLIGGILGAQTTDEQVNKVTATLYLKYPEIADYALLSEEELRQEIRSIGLYRNKSKSIIGAAKKIMADFGGKVPFERDDLLSLPGVGPKVASLVRGDYFEIPAIVVDTHCGRISQLIGLTESGNPQIIERELMQILPPEYWINWGHYLVLLGRSYCKARCRNCLACPLRNTCLYATGDLVKKKIQAAEMSEKTDGCF